MFNLDWSELLIIAVIAVLVVGPKELPGMLRTIGRYVAKMRKVAGEFRTQFDQAMKEAELDGVQDAVRETRSALNKINPAGEIKKAMTAVEDTVKDVPAAINAPSSSPPPGPSVNGTAASPSQAVPSPAAVESIDPARRSVAERASEAWKKAAGDNEGGT